MKKALMIQIVFCDAEYKSDVFVQQHKGRIPE